MIYKKKRKYKHKKRDDEIIKLLGDRNEKQKDNQRRKERYSIIITIIIVIVIFYFLLIKIKHLSSNKNNFYDNFNDNVIITVQRTLLDLYKINKIFDFTEDVNLSSLNYRKSSKKN